MARFTSSGLMARMTALTAVLVIAIPGAASAQAPDRIDLPDGWQPEGITSDGTSLYVGSLADGAVWKGDPATGEGAILVEGSEGSVAVGIDHEPGQDRLWVAGGPTGRITAYDAQSGDQLAQYAFEGESFINDLVVTEHGVFATDSMNPRLLEVPFEGDGSLPGEDRARDIEYAGAYEHQEGFNANGIVAPPGWLVIVQSTTGRLFRVDPASGRTFGIDTGDVELSAGDGLELDGDRLYVVRNRASTITVLDLGPWLAEASLVDEITSPDFDVPTTATLTSGGLWAANARFGTEPTPGTEYWITRVDVPAS